MNLFICHDVVRYMSFYQFRNIFILCLCGMLALLGVYFILKGLFFLGRWPDKFLSMQKRYNLEKLNTKQRFITSVRIFDILLGIFLIVWGFIPIWSVWVIGAVLVVIRIIIRVKCL